MICNNFGNFMTKTFADEFKSADDFLNEYKANGIPATISDDSVKTLYYLWYSRYGNSNIANADENQFKYRVWSTIFMYGPTWEKRLEIQEKFRNMSEEDLMAGSRNLYNHSYGTSQPIFSMNEQNQVVAEGTDTDTELSTINEQNASKNRKGKVEAYGMLLALLETDVTNEFLTKFKSLFLTIVQPYSPLWYSTPLSEENYE